MKPTRSRIYCRDSAKSKILFETEKKANNFIKFNAEEIKAESGFSPVRSYFCMSCGGYHVTSKEVAPPISRAESVLEHYTRFKEDTKTGKERMKQIKENRKKQNKTI